MSTNSPLPQTMLTLQHTQSPPTPGYSHGHLALLHTPLPTPSQSQLLLRVSATTLSAGELSWPRPNPISVPGVDVAGTVLTSPPNSAFKPGDKVYARTTFPREGSAREFTLAEEGELALRPRNVGAEEAASVPMSALTAWQGLFGYGGLVEPGVLGAKEGNKGKRVLVTAASGGVGGLGVQLAVAAGAEVLGTCGPSNVEMVKGLGASEVLDYSVVGVRDWAERDAGNRVDVVLDCVGGSVLEEAWFAVREGGKVLSIYPPTPPYSACEELVRPEGVVGGVTGVFFIVVPDGEMLGRVTGLIEEGRVRAVVDSVWEMWDWERALERVNGGHARGKVVLRVAGE